MPLFQGERPLQPYEREDFHTAFLFVQDQLGGPVDDFRYSAVNIDIPSAGANGGLPLHYVYLVARSTMRDTHWVFDDDREEWVEDAQFNRDGYILYPDPTGGYIGLEGEDVWPIPQVTPEQEALAALATPYSGGHFEVTQRIRFPPRAKAEDLDDVPRKSAWERLGEDDPFGD